MYFAKQGFAVADIEYADGSTGTLIYIETTLTDDVSLSVQDITDGRIYIAHTARKLICT